MTVVNFTMTRGSLESQSLDKILKAVQAREFPKTCCPSEVARSLPKEELGELGCTDWRAAMVVVREAAWELRQREKLDITQKGEAIDVTSLSDIKGPIRLRVRPETDRA